MKNYFFKNNNKKYNRFTDLMLSAENEIIKSFTILHESDFDPDLSTDNKTRRVYYISDIHIDHKLHNKFTRFAIKYIILNIQI